MVVVVAVVVAAAVASSEGGPQRGGGFAAAPGVSRRDCRRRCRGRGRRRFERDRSEERRAAPLVAAGRAENEKRNNNNRRPIFFKSIKQETALHNHLLPSSARSSASAFSIARMTWSTGRPSAIACLAASYARLCLLKAVAAHHTLHRVNDCC